MRLETIRWDGAGQPDERHLRQQLEDEGFDVFLWRDQSDADYQPHSHSHDESLWVVAGELVFGVAGQDCRLRPGDRLMLPRGTVHTARAGPDGATYLIGQRSRTQPRHT